MVQHRAKGQRRQLIQQPCAGIGQHMEGGVMGEGRGHAVQHIAQHPAARHPRAERQAATWLLDPRAPKIDPPECLKRLKELENIESGDMDE